MGPRELVRAVLTAESGDDGPAYDEAADAVIDTFGWTYDEAAAFVAAVAEG